MTGALRATTTIGVVFRVAFPVACCVVLLVHAAEPTVQPRADRAEAPVEYRGARSVDPEIRVEPEKRSPTAEPLHCPSADQWEYPLRQYDVRDLLAKGHTLAGLACIIEQLRVRVEIEWRVNVLEVRASQETQLRIETFIDALRHLEWEPYDRFRALAPLVVLDDVTSGLD